jgi:hypothetical protein
MRTAFVLAKTGNRVIAGGLIKTDRFRLPIAGLQPHAPEPESARRRFERLQHRACVAAPPGAGAHEHPLHFATAVFGRPQRAAGDRFPVGVADQEHAAGSMEGRDVDAVNDGARIPGAQVLIELVDQRRGRWRGDVSLTNDEHQTGSGRTRSMRSCVRRAIARCAAATSPLE